MTNLIEFDKNLLRLDRTQRGLSVDFAVAQAKELGDRISPSSITRAEHSGLISRYHLTVLSRVLGYPVERYLISTDESAKLGPTVADLTGNWIALYLEQDETGPPYVVEEKLVISQVDENISGWYEPKSHRHHDPKAKLGTRVFQMQGTVRPGVVIGQYQPLDGLDRGTGQFTLRISRAGRYCEGFCTYCSEDGDIVLSLNVWICKSIHDCRLVQEQAERKMTREAQRLFWIAPTPLRAGQLV